MERSLIWEDSGWKRIRPDCIGRTFGLFAAYIITLPETSRMRRGYRLQMGFGMHPEDVGRYVITKRSWFRLQREAKAFVNGIIEQFDHPEREMALGAIAQ
jgi:hypothetical protein